MTENQTNEISNARGGSDTDQNMAINEDIEAMTEQLLKPSLGSHRLYYAVRDWFQDLTSPYKASDYFIAAYLLSCKINGINSRDFLILCLNVSIEANKPQLFENEVIFAAVTRAWRESAIQAHFGWMSLHILLLIAITVSNFSFHKITHQAMSSFQERGLWALIGFIIIATFIFATRECYHLYHFIKNREPIIRYIINTVDWLAYSLTLAGSIARCVDGSETKTSAALMSVATLFMFLQGLLYLRPFRIFGPTLRMVFAIFDSTIPLIFILFVINFGFTQSFYLLSYQNPSLDAFDPYNSFLFTFIYMTGQANWQDMFHTSSPELAKALLSLFVVLTTILTLNLIIAKMNFVYGQVNDNLIGEWKREQCKLIIKHSIYGISYNTNQELIALIRRNDLERMDEEKRRRVRMQTIDENVQEMKKQYAEDMKDLKEQLDRLIGERSSKEKNHSAGSICAGGSDQAISV